MEERKLLYRLKFGSFLYGLQTPSSDIDYVSVVMPLPKDLLGLQKMESIDSSTKKSDEKRKNTSDDIDDISYTLHRFIHLLINGNPSLTECLFSNDFEYEHPIITELKSIKDKIISNRVKDSFLGFSFSQKMKLLTKKERYFSLKNAVEFIQETFADKLSPEKDSYLLTQEELDYVNNTLKYYKGEKGNIEHFHKGMSLRVIFERLSYELGLYGWRVKTQNFETLGYDAKFGYHSIRLLMEGKELLLTGNLTMPIPEPNHSILMDIKNGNVSYEELIKLYDMYEKEVKEIESVLNDIPDFNFINDWLINKILEDFKG